MRSKGDETRHFSRAKRTYEVTVLHDVTFGGLLLGHLELFEQRFFGDVFRIGIFHPVHGVQVTQVRLTLVIVVAGIGGFFRVRGCGSVDVDVGGQ